MRILLDECLPARLRRDLPGHEVQTVPGTGWAGIMLEQIDGKIAEHHLGKLRLETAAAKAGRIVSEELGRLNWKETDLRSRRKSAPAKLAMAARLRRETALSIKAIASRFHLGTSKSADIRLHTAMRLTAPAETAQATFGL